MTRRGATLTEVLMSILVMGIGVLSVITLFPASFLRTMQATNITHATVLRYNADALIDIDRTNRATVYPYWQPATAYVAGANPSIVLAPIASGGDNRRYVCRTAGTSDGAAPAWDTTVGSTTMEASGVEWECEDHSRYVIDPMGWNFAGPGLEDYFGNDGAAPFIPPAPFGRLQRFNAKAGTALLADALCTLPDSWTLQVQGIPSVPAPPVFSIDMPVGVDLTEISHYDPAMPPATPRAGSRVVLSDATGKRSETRWINSILGQTLNFSDEVKNFTPTQARIETQERRYTWMISVRRSSAGIPSVEVAVFFRRDLTPADERVFNAATNGKEVTIDHAGGVAPRTKKGGFIFDVENARWYRIQDSIAWSGTQTRVTLDRAPIDDVRSIIAPRGVVDVYPIESKP